ncbi:RXT2-like protein [Kalaharituber pfeilii]|nr:RXT2-like protein [Kalaharituber pfeilii]
MAERAALIDLVTNFKAALKRRGDESESDDSIAYPSNRGRKLKHRARYVREGQLDAPTGPRVYKEKVEYGGAQRYIIHRYKRRKRDEDADEESDEDSEETIEEEDPFDQVDLEKILAPINNPADLPSHPTLSLPYTSKILDQLCQQALEIMQPEHEHTIAIKNLLTTFLGDDEFASLGNLESPEMPEFMKQAQEAAKQKALPNGITDRSKVNGNRSTQGKSKQHEGVIKSQTEDKLNDGMELDTEEEHPEAGNAIAQLTARMTTRSLQQQQHATAAPSSPTVSSPRMDIDPFFYPPNYVIDRDFGIPPQEADETRRLLLHAVQRQEEFIRGLNKVYLGLLQAKRKKQDVWRWCRAMEGVREYHAIKAGRDISEITEEEMLAGLSDNEDWYDRDEWTLDQDLIKGKEDEEEEEKTKKTRGRRA